ncbi:MAG TPA: DUF4873 domain-containing protein [Streptosporangiaceae bacterium]|jgi:hypothetical protein
MPAAAGQAGPAQQGAGPGDGDGYQGQATVRIGTSRLRVEVQLRGYFQPIDGRYHWYGRAAPHDGLTAAVESGRRPAVLSTPDGSAPCEVSDPDPWQRYRITGVSTPPFATELASGRRAPGS